MANATDEHTVALGLAYQGTHFAGWQRQRDVASVQQTLEQALSQVAAAPTVVQAAGRTDAGVHATGQTVHFRTRASRPIRAWVKGVNSLMPNTVAVQWAQPVNDKFHARFGASERRYQYIFCDAQVTAPGLSEQSWQVANELDDGSMHQAAQKLVGEHDFSSYRGAGCQAPTPFRRLHRVSVSRHADLVVLDVTANAFLLHMVRNIAGALVQVGAGHVSADWPAQMLAARDRRLLGPTAPPQGLYLVGVRYPGYDLPIAPSPPLLRGLGPLAPG